MFFKKRMRLQGTLAAITSHTLKNEPGQILISCETILDNRLLGEGNNLSYFKSVPGSRHWRCLGFFTESRDARRARGAPFRCCTHFTGGSYLLVPIFFAEAEFDGQPQLGKIAVKIPLIKKMWGFQSCAVAREGVGHCPPYWAVGCFATVVHQDFSRSRKERRGTAR